MFERMATFTNVKLVDTEDFVLTIGDLFLIAIVFLIVRFIAYLIKRSVNKRVRLHKLDEGKAYSVYRISIYFIYTISIVFALDIIGLNISVLLAGSTALLVGLGLGLQDAFKDFVSGVILLIEGTISAGDIIEVNGLVAKIVEVRLRTTVMKTRDDIVMIMPNQKLTSDQVINWTENSVKTRFSIDVGVAYGSDTKSVSKYLIEAANDHSEILNKPQPTVQFRAFGESSLDFKLFFHSEELFRIEKIKSDLRFNIDKKFRDHHITIPFPQRDIWIKSNITQKE